MAKRIYNRVVDDRGCYPFGELLTDKELDFIHRYNLQRNWPNTVKVIVRTKDVYRSFGARFATSFTLMQENNGD